MARKTLLKNDPVSAGGGSPAEVATVERMRDFTQCIIRDSAVAPAEREYFLIDSARTCTVTVHIMKREVIRQGLGWGQMPDYLVVEDLRKGRLLSIANTVFRGGFSDIVAARKVRRAPGQIAAAVWNTVARLPAKFTLDGCQWIRAG